MAKKQVTFAERAKKIIEQFKDREDKFSNDTKRSLLKDLAMEQEQVKARAAEAEAKRTGNLPPGAQAMSDAGVQPGIPGAGQRFRAQTGMTPGQASGMAPQGGGRGMMNQQFPFGGPTGTEISTANQPSYWDRKNTSSDLVGNNVFPDLVGNNIIPDQPTNILSPITDAAQQDEPFSYKPRVNYWEAAPVLANLLAMGSLQPYDTIQPESVELSATPYLTNRRGITETMLRDSAATRDAMTQSGAGNFAQMSNALNTVNNSTGSNIANAMLQADAADRQEMGRVEGIQNQEAMLNARERARVQDLNMANQGMYDSSRLAYLLGIGGNLASLGRLNTNALNAADYIGFMRESGMSQALMESLYRDKAERDYAINNPNVTQPISQ